MNDHTSTIDTFLGILWGIVACLVITLLGGCKTVKYVPVESHTTDTLYQVKVERDSIHTRDSIYIHEWASPTGDTIYIDRDRFHTLYRDRWHTDTIHRTHTDTIQVPYPVAQPLTRWQQFCIDYGKMGAGATILFFITVFVWLVRRLSKVWPD